MLAYVTIGTNDLEKALVFYDALVGEMGGKRMFENHRGQFYGFSEGALFAVMQPEDGQSATGGNGNMLAFKQPSQQRVDEIYAKALALGASDAGPPGPRGDRGFYASYFRDLDGNKVCVYIM